jgi:hypothetical protein|tara:strand:+ start:159 stop:512 length:354 start_codon:yes stop_codon:yes gene_type:complete
MLIPNPTRKEDTFFVTSANWTSVINAENYRSAGTKALEEVILKYNKSAEVSPTITVVNISRGMKEMDLGKNVSFIYTPEALADAGHHSKSSSFHEIIKNMQGRLGKDHFPQNPHEPR